MKQLFIALLLLTTITVTAQVPALPTTKEEFVSSEKDFIAAEKWLETTAIGTDTDKRKQLDAWVTAWVINSPTVTVEVRASILKLFDKNSELTILFMAGYSRYCLENNYSKDELKCNVAGIRAAINCFNLGGDVKNNKNLTKVIEQEKEGKLEEWVAAAMKDKK
ncbi:hypothetical protein [Ferruginibacter sp. SUN106]|uniref:hypothetical protein n=1 Tax=Ferruginibacter sp. SUN106 TaxID=2978348 RepID=UPI003D367D3B